MTGARRTAGDRRAQLVGIGLELLPTTPVQERTIDEVARRAGTSRSLLFHYLPTERDCWTAVTEAAAALLRAHVVPRPGTPEAGQLHGMLDRFVGWVETYRDGYAAFVRGAAGGDPWVADGRRQRQLVRAWFAFTEDLVVQWTWEPTSTRDELLDQLQDVLERVTTR